MTQQAKFKPITLEQFHDAYDNCSFPENVQPILVLGDKGYAIDPIFGWGYKSTSKKDCVAIRRKRAVVSLINEHRPDFPRGWEKMLWSSSKTVAELIAGKMFVKGEFVTLEAMTKAYWVTGLDLSDWRGIHRIPSYNLFRSHFWASVVLEYLVTGSMQKAFASHDLEAGAEILKAAFEYIQKHYDLASMENLRMFPYSKVLLKKKIINYKDSDITDEYQRVYVDYLRQISDSKKQKKALESSIKVRKKRVTKAKSGMEKQKAWRNTSKI